MKRTQNEFIEILKRFFGENYDYSLVHYINNSTIVTLCCKKHGIFKRIPTDLTKGKGCQKCSYEKLSQERLKWDKKGAFEVSKKFTKRSDFKHNEYAAYKLSKKNGWLNEMTWLLPSDKWSKNNFVYAYVDEENKTVYIGLTCDKINRDWSHRHKKDSTVFKYFNSIIKEIPDPIYLEENLSKTNAQAKEDEWIHKYKENGYVVLNKAKTGIGVSSIGGGSVKWTKNKVFLESKKYNTRNSFKKGCSSAYAVALKNKWLDEMPWLILKRHSSKLITKEQVIEQVKKYKYKSYLRKYANLYFTVAEKNGWLDELDFEKYSKKGENVKWTKEECYKAAKECETLNEFRLNYERAYKVSKKNNWIDYNIFNNKT